MKRKLSLWREKLITREDFLSLHKILGLSCLASFLWRFSYTFHDNDLAFQDYPSLTLPTIILHLSLNLSSFIFHIPAKRISSGYRIWPEYRIHSLIFAGRPCAVMFVYWWSEQNYTTTTTTTQQHHSYSTNLVICGAALLFSDIASKTVAYRSNSIRELPVSPVTRYFFSQMQFYGTTGMLLGVGRYTTCMVHLVIVQLNAFFMTLRRKNLVPQSALLVLYGVTLVTGLTAVTREYTRSDVRMVCVGSNISILAFLWRCGIWNVFLKRQRFASLQSKYLVWTVMGVVWIRYLQPWLEATEPVLEWPLTVLTGLCAVTTVSFGYYKSRHGEKNE